MGGLIAAGERAEWAYRFLLIWGSRSPGPFESVGWDAVLRREGGDLAAKHSRVDAQLVRS